METIPNMLLLPMSQIPGLANDLLLESVTPFVLSLDHSEIYPQMVVDDGTTFIVNTIHNVYYVFFRGLFKDVVHEDGIYIRLNFSAMADFLRNAHKIDVPLVSTSQIALGEIDPDNLPKSQYKHGFIFNDVVELVADDEIDAFYKLLDEHSIKIVNDSNEIFN